MSDTLAIVPTYLRVPVDLEVLFDMLSSLTSTEPELEVLIVDDGSPAENLVDEVAARAERDGFTLVRRTSNQGFARTVNVGLKRARNRGMNGLLVNADIKFVEPGWLALMEGQEDSDGDPAWVVGALLMYPSGLIQHAGIMFSLLHRHFGHIYQCAPADLPEAQVPRICPVTGALQFIRHEALMKVGVYDEDFRLGFEDVDFCLRVFKAGAQCVYQPEVKAYHLESMFRGRHRGDEKVQRWEAESWRTFLTKWGNQSMAAYVPSLI